MSLKMSIFVICSAIKKTFKLDFLEQFKKIFKYLLTSHFAKT